MGMKKEYVVIGIVLLALAFYAGMFQGVYNPPVIPPECLTVAGTNVGMCCYDINKNLVPCSQPTGGMAVFQGTPGIYWVRPFARATNTGNTNIKAYLTSCTSSPTNEFGQSFSAAPAQIGLEKIIAPSDQSAWIPTTDNMVYIGDMDGQYTITASVCAQALLPDGTIDPNIQELCNSGSGSFSITKEAISFTVGVGS